MLNRFFFPSSIIISLFIHVLLLGIGMMIFPPRLDLYPPQREAKAIRWVSINSQRFRKIKESPPNAFSKKKAPLIDKTKKIIKKQKKIKKKLKDRAKVVNLITPLVQQKNEIEGVLNTSGSGIKNTMRSKGEIHHKQSPLKATKSEALLVAQRNKARVLKEYLREVRRKVKINKRYPYAAKRMGLNARFRVRFRVHSGGHVSKLRFVLPKPHAIFQKASKRAVFAASPFSRLPKIMGSHLDVEIPLSFQIK